MEKIEILLARGKRNRYELVDSNRAALRKQLIELCKVDDLVLDPVGVLEATQLW